jgi:hypothetical protein
MNAKSKSSPKKKPLARVRDLKPIKDAKGGSIDIDPESTDDKHKRNIVRAP